MISTILICAALALSDGDSGWCHPLDAPRVKVRLAGVDAGEMPPYTRCRSSPNVWACSPVARQFAPAATARARELVSDGAVCTVTGKDRWRRDVAICTAYGEDIASVLVREGLAISEPNFRDPYRAEEDEARRERRGVWE